MKKIVSLLMLLIVTLSLSSCVLIRVAAGAASLALSSQKEKPPKNYWTDGIPDTIPKFNYGKFIRSSKMVNDDTTYFLEYTGVSKEDIDAYGEALKTAGFDVTTNEDNEFYGVMAMPEDYENINPSVSANMDPSKGTCDVMVTVDNDADQ